jgi:hypothetical protein
LVPFWNVWPIKIKEAILSLISKATLPLIAAAAVLAGAMFADSAIAGTIVVRSNGPSAKAYPPGKQLGDNGAVVLKAGDSVTILDGRGTRVLKGPGTFSTTASSGAASGSAIGQLLKNTGTRQARTGAVRSIGVNPAATRSPNLWYVDANRAGTFCLADKSSATIWRPTIGQPATMTIKRVSDGQSAVLEFAAGQSAKSWPTSLPLALDADYQFADSGSNPSAVPVTLRFAAMAADPQGIEGTAAALIKNGCNGQLDLLVDTFAIPAKDAAL